MHARDLVRNYGARYGKASTTWMDVCLPPRRRARDYSQLCAALIGPALGFKIETSNLRRKTTSKIGSDDTVQAILD